MKFTPTPSVRVTIRRGGRVPYTPVQASPLAPETQQRPAGKVDQFSQAPYTVVQPPDEEIIVELSQAMVAAASSSAQASASREQIPPIREQNPPLGEHSRLGVALTTMPGILAADLQLLRLDVPPWLLGVPLEVGWDLVVNLQAVGVGASVGGKAFGLAGYWVDRQGETGLCVGLGARF